MKNDDYNNLMKQVIESGIISKNDWLEQDKLLASDGTTNDYFGISVSINGDYALIGAYGDGAFKGSAYVFTSENQPPNNPTIDGPTSGKPGIIYDYDFTNCVDPDGDDMTYHVEWGDGGIDEGFVESGGAFTLSHSWSEKGDFTIRAQLIDVYGAESDWAYLEVTMPRNKIVNRPFLYFLESHPNMFPILRQLLGL